MYLVKTDGQIRERVTDVLLQAAQIESLPVGVVVG